MRKRVEYYAWLPFRVVLAQPPGVPGESFQIYVGDWYFGDMVKKDGEWIAHLSPNAWKSVSIEDVRAMGDVIDEQYQEDSETA